MTGNAKRARYTLEFELEQFGWLGQGKAIAAVGATLVVEQTVSNWVKAEREGGLAGVGTKLVGPEQMELPRLRAKVGMVASRHCCIVADILTCWQHEPDLWPDLRSIVMVESTREIGDGITTERRSHLSSLPPDAMCIAYTVRAHWWCIEMACTGRWIWPSERSSPRVRVNNAAPRFASCAASRTICSDSIAPPKRD
ncbi:hypothetical protein SAMN05444172_8988 [Burkholderia sp. GAS332]|nr:hypothetical protein SAMN05444172_8988 [Burkholderia sp. GAS332]